ncbi:MAG: ABC transporter ATP-binding protein [Ferruginibacter sp.]
MPPLLSIENLSINFRQEGNIQAAVKNISFQLFPGEITAIVGESGSGKSVTALSLLQLLPAGATTEGLALFQPDQNEAVALLEAPAERMQKIRGNQIAMIFQEPMTSLNPVLSCGQQVMEAILLHQPVSRAEAKLQVLSLFEKVQLPDPAAVFKRYPHQLSGGQKQRVVIAMAMSCHPALLIADEPTTALDVTVQKNILDLIARLQREEQMAVLLVTHDLGVVADIANRIIVMYKGEIVEQGPAASILQSPDHNYTRALLACRPAGKPRGQRLPVVSDFMNPGQEKEEKPLPPVSQHPQKEELNNPVLIVEDLCVSYPAQKNFWGKPLSWFHAVDHVSFAVGKGETVGLVGESGCGKTTLGRTVLQLIKPGSGRILLNGRDISREKPATLRRLRKDLQIVFQDPYGSLDPRITIGEAILEPLKVHGLLHSNSQRKEKVMALLEKVSLNSSHFNRYPHQLSGGQRQRICIARALATGPSFLIFDESVSALDVSVQAQVLNLLDDLKKELGFSAIFISHDLAVVHHICDRILVMQQGRIVEEGTATAIYHHPQQEYTRQLINAIPGKKLIVS